MKKLRFQFALFALFLILLFGFLSWHYLGRIQNEEERLAQRDAERTFNLMQSRISDFLSSEDARPFEDYETGNVKGMLYEPPLDDPRGLYGYFSVLPDGRFSTPHNLKEFPALKTELEQLTVSLREDLAKTDREKIQDKKEKNVKGDFIDLDSIAYADPSSPEPSARSNSLDSYQLSGSGSANFRKDRSVPKKQVYPNPLLQNQMVEQKVQAPSPAKNSPPSAPASLADPSDDLDVAEEGVSAGGSLGILSGEYDRSNASSVPVGNAIQAPKLSEDEISAAILNSDENPIMSDPFRARLVNSTHLVFYRKSWRQGKLYLQGFIVVLKKFHDWLMFQSFADSSLKDMAQARLKIENDTLAEFGATISGAPRKIFGRQLGYPLNLFTWELSALRLPALPTRQPAFIAIGITLCIIAMSLAALYRTTASQIELSQKRQDFASAITHELKTPLTSIRLSAEMLREGWLDTPEKRDEYYSIIANESERLTRLIENVLQLSRLEKNTLKCEFVEESPQNFFRTTARELREYVENNGFTWSEIETGDLPVIKYDPTLLKQVLWTLTDNAIKFSDSAQDKSVTFKIEILNKQTVFSISDRGPGIPKNEIHRVFEKFYRVENELTRKTKGTGIGLAMAKMMMDRMGGRIELENHKDGKGLKVLLFFPS